MVKSIAALGLTLLLTVIATEDKAQAAVLHDNSGATSTGAVPYYNSSAFGWAVADTFQLDEASTIESFSIGYTNERALGKVNIAVYDLSFNALYGLSTVDMTNADTGLDSTRIAGHNIYLGTTEALSITLDAGRYWFAYQLEETGSVANPARISAGAITSETLNTSFLQNSNGFSQWATAFGRGNAGALDFTVNGVEGTPAVPLPAGLPLLVGALGAFGVLSRRKKAAS